jgi:hypothetical protein
MAVRNYTKTILIRARKDEAQSWARSAGDGGKKLSVWVREALNERAGYDSGQPERAATVVVATEPETEGAEAGETLSTDEATEPTPVTTPTSTDDDDTAWLDQLTFDLGG